MAARAKKTEEKVESVDLAPLQKELESLRKEVEALKKDVVECKKCCSTASTKQSSAGASALAQQLVDALKDMSGPNTKGVRNYIRSIFK